MGSANYPNAKQRKCPGPGQPQGPHAKPWNWSGRTVGSTHAVLACAMAANLTAGIAAPPVIGSFRAWYAQEVVGANLVGANPAGRSLEFEPQSSDGSSRVSGCLQRRTGRFLLKDENTHVMVELTGPHLDKEANHRIEAVGSLDPAAIPLSEASEVIRVTSVKRIGKACVGATAAATAGVGSLATAGTLTRPGNFSLFARLVISCRPSLKLARTALPLTISDWRLYERTLPAPQLS